jgi:hypothetical protein
MSAFYYVDKINTGEKDATCSTHMEDIKAYKAFIGKPEEKKLFEKNMHRKQPVTVAALSKA